MAAEEPVAFVEVGPAGGHRLVLGGVTALERNLWALGKKGLKRALVAAEPMPLRPDLPIAVEWVTPGSPAPAGAVTVRGDHIAGRVVEDEPSRRAAEWEVVSALGKSYQGPVDALVNRHVSTRITRQLAKSKLVPNHVTGVAVVVGLAAAALVLQGGWLRLAVAGVMMEFQSILDSCDGELARLRFQYSRFGQWFDNVSDDVLDNLFIACAGLAAGGPWLWLGAGGAAARLVVATFAYVVVYRKTGTGDVYQFRWWFERGKHSADEVYDPTSPLTWLRSLGRRDTYVFIFMFLCLAGQARAVAGYGAALGAVQLSMLLAHLTIGRAGKVPA